MVHHSIAVVITSFLTNFVERRQCEVQHSPAPDGPGPPALSQQKSQAALWRSRWRKRSEGVRLYD